MREALALAIVRNQWEPADSLLMMRLRLWAHLELESRREAGTTPGIDSAEARGALSGRTDRDGRPDGDAQRPALRPLRPVPRIAIQGSDGAPPAQPDAELPGSLRRLRRASGQR